MPGGLRMDPPRIPGAPFLSSSGPAEGLLKKRGGEKKNSQPVINKVVTSKCAMTFTSTEWSSRSVPLEEIHHGGDGATAMLGPRSAKMSGWKEQGLPVPCTLYPVPPCALRPAPCALRPAPCTLHPVPLHAWPESVTGSRTH